MALVKPDDTRITAVSVTQAGTQIETARCKCGSCLVGSLAVEAPYAPRFHCPGGTDPWTRNGSDVVAQSGGGLFVQGEMIVPIESRVCRG